MSAIVFRGGRRLAVGAGLAAVTGAVLLGAAAIFDVRAALSAYLSAFTYCASLAVGSLVFVMIVHTIGARWPLVVRRLGETIAATLPLLLLLSVPVLIFTSELYPWAADGASGHSYSAHRRPYLNAPFFAIRSIAYLAIWSGLALLLRRWSLQQDTRSDEPVASRQRVLSAVSLPAMGLTLTLAAIDWLMSLHPVWVSTIFGIYYFAGGILGALALLTLLGATADGPGPLGGILSRSHYYALGRLLLTFVAFWAYVAFFQLFIIWFADRPEEVSFYLERIRGPWGVLAAALAVGHFAIPFVLLLSYRLKQSRAFLAAMSAWLLVIHYVDVVWVALPASHAQPETLLLAAVGAPLLFGGILCAFGVWLLRGHDIVPRRDPAFAAAVEYQSE